MNPNMKSKNLISFIRYYLIFQMILGIVINKKELLNWVVVFIFVFIINNQLMEYSFEKLYLKVASFIIEMILIFIGYKFIGGYLLAYLLIASIDSNMMLEGWLKVFFDICIVAMGAYFLIGQGLEPVFINLGTIVSVTLILYFVKDENDRKLEAQNLYDRLRISEVKLRKANEDLELYAASIEEITLLRERNRISREIHDSVGHALSTIVIQLGAIEKTIGLNGKAAEGLTKNLRAFTQKSLDEVRMAVREIKPKEFEKYEGIAVIEELVKNFKKLSGIDVRLSFTKEKWSLSKDQTFVIYRITQEFLANSARHGKATMVQIFMAFNEYKLTVTLKDNGTGCENIIEGIGLKSMRERTMEIGGTFEYSSKKDEGFLVKVEFDKKEKPKIYAQGDENE